MFQAPARNASLATTSSPPRARGAALVVDDDDDLREIFVELLQQDGWRAQGVATVAAARRKIGAVRPDLVVLDFQLEGETTEPLLAELATMPCAPAALLVSASVVAAEIAALHGVPLLPKPFDADAFLARAKLAVENARAARSGTRPLRLETPSPSSRRVPIAAVTT